MAFQTGIQQSAPIGASGSTAITSDLGIASSTVMTAIQAFEGKRLSVEISGSSATIKTIADV